MSAVEWWLVAIGLFALLAIALVGWLAIKKDRADAARADEIQTAEPDWFGELMRAVHGGFSFVVQTDDGQSFDVVVVEG